MNSGLWASSCFGVPPTEISQPSDDTPVGDSTPVTVEYRNGGECAITFSRTFIPRRPVARDRSSTGLTALKYSCDKGWMTNAKRLIRR